MTDHLPPYAYVPGHWPHPTRDPQGHSAGAQASSAPSNLDLLEWEACENYQRGITLFNHGYYWEAHEAWEDIWRLNKKHATQAQFLQGLIKVAAAGIKIRQGHAKAARSLLTQSAKHFQKVMEKHLEKLAGGIHMKVLERWCRDFRDEVSDIKADPSLNVEIIFPAFNLQSNSADAP